MEESNDVEFSYIASKIIKKGINNIDFSMLPEDRKSSILSKVALLLYKENHYEEAIKIIDMSGNKEMIKQWMEEFVSEKKSKYAALCAISLGNKEKIEELGMWCVDDGHYDVALVAFKSVNREDLMEFVRLNLFKIFRKF